MNGMWRAGVVSAMVIAGMLTGGQAEARKKEPEGKLMASAPFRDAITGIRSRLDAGDLAGAGVALGALSPAGPLEKYMVASLGMELAVKRGDIVAQRAAIAKLIETEGVPEGQLAHLNHIAGFLCYQTGAIDNAVVYLTRARALGLKDPQASLLLVESYVRQRKMADAAQLLDETIDLQKQAGKVVPESWYKRASSFAYARKDWPALARYNAALLTGTDIDAADWRSALASYIEGAGPDKEALLDLYRLQAATGALASERDYQGYATLAAGQGYSAEAKSIIDSGVSAGKLTGNDPVAAPLMRTLGKRAVTYLASIKGLPGKADKVATGAKAAQDGDTLLASSQYAEAVPYYRAALEKGVTDRDRVLTRLGIALARSGDFAGAKNALAQVTGPQATAPQSTGQGIWPQIATYWAAWVDTRTVAQAEAETARPTQTASAAR